MEKRSSRVLVLAGAILVLFISTVAILLNVIPGPHRNLDYLVIGAVATFLSMILLWVVMIQGWLQVEASKPRLAASEPDEPTEKG
jgi:NADH:ubiquinone oxidoreductase subunit 6 (subunit J)